MLLTELSSPTHIHYEESNLSFLHDSPRHFNCGSQLICTDGEAVVSTGAQQFHLEKMSELIFWRGSILQLIHSTPDFRVRMVLYPSKIFLQAAINLDSTFFNYMKEIPYKDHTQAPYNGSMLICGWTWLKCYLLSPLRNSPYSSNKTIYKACLCGYSVPFLKFT